jgi:hypothetical protein
MPSVDLQDHSQQTRLASGPAAGKCNSQRDSKLDRASMQRIRRNAAKTNSSRNAEERRGPELRQGYTAGPVALILAPPDAIATKTSWCVADPRSP